MGSLGINTLGDLFVEGTAKTWDEVVAQAEAHTALQRFQFHRIHRALLERLGSDLQEPPDVPELTYIIKTQAPTRLISNLYKIAMSHRANKYTKARLDWQRDLGTQMDDAMWRYCCVNTQKISLHGRHRLVHFKFLNRTYYTPERMHRYGLSESADCPRCYYSPADFMHLAWQCPGIATYWEGIFGELSRIMDQNILQDPALALLGYSKPLPKGIRRTVDMGLLLARRRLAMHWMRGPLPKISQWMHDVLYCSTQTEQYSELLPPRSRPKNFWGLYHTYAATKEAGGGGDHTDPGACTDDPRHRGEYQ